ncbi:MAG: TonB-dependent receptor [Flavobacteriaceae bacterium]|nr:TonB-dependent receptor [Flavobacteriaceae bacterium]
MKTKFLISILLLCGFSRAFSQDEKFTISGYIYQKGSKESLIGVNVYIPELQSGTASNNYGFYSLTLPKGKYVLHYSYIGYTTVKKEIDLNKDVKMDIEIQESIELDEVVVVAQKKKKLSQTAQMSEIEIPISQIKEIPALLGEKDVLKALQLMPGVQSGTEGNSGMYVRGGGPDQNLIILDDAPVYNANHLFGFFSIFNGDALKSVSLTKGGFPARYGGRLSSVLEMNMKDGNKEELSGEVGIGLVSSRATIEAPIVKGKSSFLISGRRTYIDLLAKPLMPDDEKIGYYFYDLNAKVNYDLNENNKLYLSGYFGRDRFSADIKDENDRTNTGLSWGNATGTLRWNHLFNNKTFANTSLIFSDYNFSIFGKNEYETDTYEMEYNSNINDIGLKYDMQYHHSPNYSLKVGFASTLHRFRPTAIVVKNNSVNEIDKEAEVVKTIESGAYIENELKLWNKLRLNAGLRLSHYHHKNKSYFFPEPRISGSFTFGRNFATKLSYAQMNQFVHLLSSTGISLPLDLWVPTTDKVQPQKSQQVAFGVVKDFNEHNFSLSVEGYYKKMDNIIGYKPGASFLLIDDANELSEYSWEESVMRGQGWSYGVEFLLQRKIGRLSGWLGYTLSWTQHQFDEDNGGEKYDARYDRRHDISLVGVYKITDNITLSGTWVYGTGNAINLPTDTYQPEIPMQESHSWQQAKHYGKKNSSRMRAYHRLDLGIQFHKKRKKYERTWEIGVYNAYMRKNPFMYQISETGTSNRGGHSSQKNNKLEQVSLFPIIPSISFNIKF